MQIVSVSVAYLGLVSLFGLCYFYVNTLHVIPFLIGAIIGYLNLFGTAVSWPMILSKKSVAFPLVIIVSKLGITVGLFYWLLKPGMFQQVNSWFFGTFFAASPVTGQAAQTGPSSVVTLLVFVSGVAMVLPAVVLAHFFSKESA